MRIIVVALLGLAAMSPSAWGESVSLSEGRIHLTLPDGFTRPTRDPLPPPQDGSMLTSIDTTRRLMVLLSVERIPGNQTSMPKLILRVAQQTAQRQWPRILREEELTIQGHCGLTTYFDNEASPRIVTRMTAVVTGDTLNAIIVAAADEALLTSPAVNGIFTSVTLDGAGQGCGSATPQPAPLPAASTLNAAERELLGGPAVPSAEPQSAKPQSKLPVPPAFSPLPESAPMKSVARPLPAEIAAMTAPPPLMPVVDLFPDDRARNWPLHRMNMRRIAKVAQEARTAGGLYPTKAEVQRALGQSLGDYEYVVSGDRKSYRVILPGDVDVTPQALDFTYAGKGETTNPNNDMILGNGKFIQWYGTEGYSMEDLVWAVNNGVADAASEIALRYEYGYGVDPDEKLAASWTQRAEALKASPKN